MRKRFVGKKSRQHFSWKLFGFVGLILFFFGFSFHFLANQWKSKLSEKDFLEMLYQDGMGNHQFWDFFRMNPTEFLLSSSMGIKPEKSTPVFEEMDESGPNYEYVPDPDPASEAKDPIVYLYNTHQSEGYSKEGLSEYDVTPSVLFANYFFREKLNDLGVPTAVETNDISEVLRTNNWKYSYSYEASRYLMKEAQNKYPHLKYFIDIHRDSANYNVTTTEYLGKKYARIMFVIGKEHDHYAENLAFANNLNEKMKTKVNNISRGVIGKEGAGVNGIYNQDISPNTLLIEVGGPYNSIVEVTNTIEVLAKVLKDYIEENS